MSVGGFLFYFSLALRKHVDSEDKGVAKCDTLGGAQKITLINSSFASTLRRTSCNTKPQRGVMVASHFRSALCDASRLKNGWYKAARKKRAFRYATSNPCLSRTYGTLSVNILITSH